MIDALGYRALFLCSAVITAAFRSRIGVLCFQGYFRIPRGEYAKRLTDERA